MRLAEESASQRPAFWMCCWGRGVYHTGSNSSELEGYKWHFEWQFALGVHKYMTWFIRSWWTWETTQERDCVIVALHSPFNASSVQLISLRKSLWRGVMAWPSSEIKVLGAISSLAYCLWSLWLSECSCVVDIPDIGVEEMLERWEKETGEVIHFL